MLLILRKNICIVSLSFMFWLLNKMSGLICPTECFTSPRLLDSLFVVPCQELSIIEGVGGKRLLGFLLKSELCQKRSKFRMQFCLRVSNNVLHVFSLKFAFFLKYYVCKKHIFPRAFSGDLLLNEKQKKPFVSLSDEVTIIAWFSYYCFVSASG